MDIQSIRRYMRYWREHTYREGVDACFYFTPEEKTQGINVLTIQRLVNTPMTGNSVQGIPRKWEGGLREISMSGTFYDAIESGYLTPASYIMRIIRSCNEHQFDNEMTIDVVGRALRTFPAFLREMDLAAKIQRRLEGCECYRGNPEDDIEGKTDIFLEYHNETYRLWSYQNSSNNALYNTLSKIREERGELPSGYYILCPFNFGDATQYEDIDGWRLYNTEYVDRIEAIIIEGEVDDYRELRGRQIQRMREYIRQMNIFRKE